MACHEFEPSTTEDPQSRRAMPVKSVEAQTSSLWCGVEVRRGCVRSGVSIAFVTMVQNYVSKSPRVAEQYDVNIPSLT
ncbi:hypothetical protein TNCV_3625701 [Trichonephila clavipes]|nr:hypothetical protein TNCV_3625701 [Trichonephila clavipes]